MISPHSALHASLPLFNPLCAAGPGGGCEQWAGGLPHRVPPHLERGGGQHLEVGWDGISTGIWCWNLEGPLVWSGAGAGIRIQVPVSGSAGSTVPPDLKLS